MAGLHPPQPQVQTHGADEDAADEADPVAVGAEAARIRAEERLQHKQSMHEYYQSKIALNRAMQRLQATAKYNR